MNRSSQAACYLGQRARAIFETLVEALAADGIDIALHRSPGWSSAEARAIVAELDLVWACGLLSLDFDAHEVVAAPIFAEETEPVYRSVLVARAGGPTSLQATLEGTFGINEIESWSGSIAPRRHVLERTGRWFDDEVLTGGHRRSIDMLIERRCDLVSIDHTIWKHLAAAEPSLVQSLRVIDVTSDAPAPPFLLRRDLETSTRRAILDVLLSAAPGDLEAIVAASGADYAFMRAG